MRTLENWFVLFITCIVLVVAQSQQQWNVTIDDSVSYSFPFWWNKCVGSGHASLALRKDWQQQILNAKLKFNITQVRFHGILDDDVGPYNGKNDYSFINIDIIFDYLVSINMQPYVEISFMPDKLASTDETVFYYKGNISPPNNWNEWNNFIKSWMEHLVDRYGIDEVSKWLFEVWNEPNCGFWIKDNGCGCENDLNKFEEYMYLYGNMTQIIKSVNERLMVGGPATAQLCWIQEFLDWIDTNDLPVDFVSTHLYPTGNNVHL